MKKQMCNILKIQLWIILCMMLAVGTCACGKQEEVGPEEEIIFQELQEGDVTFLAKKDGIYRVTSAGEECIYDIFPGIEPCMRIYENRLYFKTDLEYTENSLDWMDSGIKFIDLETLEVGVLELEQELIGDSSKWLDFIE